MSSRHPVSTEAARNYAIAFAIHYVQEDLLAALRAYDQVIEHHPASPEADYSRAQMRNIVARVVPARELLASEVEAARRRLTPSGTPPS